MLLTHDLLLSRDGIAAPKNHVLALTISRHRARLSAELTRVKLKRGFSTIEALRECLSKPSTLGEGQDNGSDGKTFKGITHSLRPRWIRINTLKTTLDEQLHATFRDSERLDSIRDLFGQESTAQNNLYIDTHIPNLIAIGPTVDYTRHPAYRNGILIFQDKASCFPAYLLNPAPDDGDMIDACAAPGNKTTHLAALLDGLPRNSTSRRQIFACDRSPERATILSHLVQRAGADHRVKVLTSDFLTLKPSDPRFANVTALLLDPSCSGSGMLDREDSDDEDEGPGLALPSRDVATTTTSSSEATRARGKKRKRKRGKGRDEEKETVSNTSAPIEEDEPARADEIADPNSVRDARSKRLESLATFQTRLLTHAFRFPAARRVMYSTCSVYVEENEDVVAKVLVSDVARERGWRVLRREEQVEGLRRWERRGLRTEGLDDEVVQACIRCGKETKEGTMGFFLCGFIKEGDLVLGEEAEKGTRDSEDDTGEWGGFSDDCEG